MYLAPEPRRGPPGLNVCEPRASVVRIARSNADEGSAEPFLQWRRQNPGSKVADETRGLPGVVGQAGREGGLEKDGRPAKVSEKGKAMSEGSPCRRNGHYNGDPGRVVGCFRGSRRGPYERGVSRNGGGAKGPHFGGAPGGARDARSRREA